MFDPRIPRHTKRLPAAERACHKSQRGEGNDFPFLRLPLNSMTVANRLGGEEGQQEEKVREEKVRGKNSSTLPSWGTGPVLIVTEVEVTDKTVSGEPTTSHATEVYICEWKGMAVKIGQARQIMRRTRNIERLHG